LSCELVRLLGVGVVVVCSARIASAIDPNRTLSQYVHDSWRAQGGFPRGPVYSIDQTKDGYLWIGTEKGLVRFDGLGFHLMQSANPKESPLSHVLGLIADGDGALWARLRRPSPTLLRYGDGIFQEVMGEFGRPQASVSAMARARDGEGSARAPPFLAAKARRWPAPR